MGKSFLLDPKVDFVFKNLFCFEENSKILISFVNSVLGTDEVVSLEVVNSEEEKHFLDDKFSRLDIIGKSQNGDKINIEIKLDNDFNIINRSIYHLSKLYEGEVKEREDCSALKRTVCINILNTSVIDNERFHNGYRFKEMETGEDLTDVQEIHFIETSKIEKAEEETLLKAWVEFLKNPESEIVAELEEKYLEILEAKEVLVKLSKDVKQREFYELREKMMKDKLAALNTTEKRALEKGLEKGKEIGKEEGIEQGKLNAKIEIARQLLDVLDDWTIAVKTGLEIDQIKEMRKE